MTKTVIRGAELHYDVVGSSGAWIALSPGGRRGSGELLPLAQSLARAGYRVLLHDRRNCGLSPVSFADDDSEFAVWADDLYELLRGLGIDRAIVGGFSSGCRMSLLLALKHPETVRALLLMRVTGGAFAANLLARKYYGSYIELARAGGMAAVCADPHFAGMIAADARNRDTLMRLPTQRFIQTMERWRASLEAGAHMPALGVDADDLKRLDMPAGVIPGNDAIHPLQVGRNVAELLRQGTLLDPGLVQQDAEFIDMDAWCGRETLARTLIDYLEQACK
ncbi:Putative aminoacrylate hydrolase RutD [Pigmentiphaga humi]|uniref:Aminoacrylate hydrolase RutD n=1 Tax=Pigmentiphaga humi TaxID=2478468 RepID=A0A3P4AXH0_9BURK|nr:alpha/beta hydrolase [Pigmentiphaga humi]VCU68231.1 Putative aminoacrylate hydrolase RutD [Pigmentiphaga humi]